MDSNSVKGHISKSQGTCKSRVSPLMSSLENSFSDLQNYWKPKNTSWSCLHISGLVFEVRERGNDWLNSALYGRRTSDACNPCAHIVPRQHLSRAEKALRQTSLKGMPPVATQRPKKDQTVGRAKA